jgi:hypothetical protein
MVRFDFNVKTTIQPATERQVGSTAGCEEFKPQRCVFELELGS